MVSRGCDTNRLPLTPEVPAALPSLDPLRRDRSNSASRSVHFRAEIGSQPGVRGLGAPRAVIAETTAGAAGTGRMAVMTAIMGVSLESKRLLALMMLLLVCAVLLAAVLLGLAGRKARPQAGRLSRWGAAALAVVLPTTMLLAVGGLVVNRAGHYLETVGDVVGSLSFQPAGAGTVLPLATQKQLDAAPADAWKADFTDAGDGSKVATWTGPVSGVSLQVKVILPSGYKPDDGRTYAVIEELHGYTGTPDSMIDGLRSAQSLQAAIDAGRIPPSIVVIPSLDVDDDPHDCANLQGRPQVGTWEAQEIPRMVQATFPNASSDRQAWMVMGISSGAYCAGWVAIENPGQFGAAGVISAFNAPTEGGLSTLGRRVVDEYTLSNMLAAHKPQGTRFYVMGAQDDPLGSAQTAWRMADAARDPDSVTPDTPESGGHAWPLWAERLPTMLQWWGQDPQLWSAVGLDAPSSPHADGDVAAIVDTPAADRGDAAAAIKPTSPAGLPVRIVAGLIAVAGVAALLRWGPLLVPAPASEDDDGARPGWPVRVGLFAARAAAVLAAAVLVAAALGLVGNAVGGFYTTWHDLASVVTNPTGE